MKIEYKIGQNGLCKRQCYCILLIFAISMLVISACTPAQIELSDEGLLSINKDELPSFWGLRPGISTEDEVKKVFLDKGISKICKHFNSEEQSGTRGIICGRNISIGYKKGTDIVNGIGFKPKDLKLTNIIEKFGNPDGIFVSSVGTSQEKEQFLSATLFFNEIMTRITLIDQSGNYFRVDGSLKVNNIAYFEQKEYEYQRDVPIQIWKGYGDYKPTE
jgi:hypothetical protein